MADDTSHADENRVGADLRDEDTDVDFAEDGINGDAHTPPQKSVTPAQIADETPGTETTPAGVAALTATEGEVEHHRVRSRAVKPRRRWPWAFAVVVLLGLLATSVSMTYEMSKRTEEWSAQVDEITVTSYDLGDQVAAKTTENVGLGDQIDLLEEQLSNSKDTVLQLSDEKAQWRDDTEFAQQQAEATEELLVTAASVANGLQRCADGQLELMNTLADAENYDPEELAAYQVSVTELCDSAEQANIDFQKALTE